MSIAPRYPNMPAPPDCRCPGPCPLHARDVDAPTAADTGLRYDAGKVRLDLLPPAWTWALAQVMTKGAEKYAPRNWEKGMPWSKVVGPMLRHAFKWLSGEIYDPETGCHHLAMVAWNALALMTYQSRGIGEQDCFSGSIREFDTSAIDPSRTD